MSEPQCLAVEEPGPGHIAVAHRRAQRVPCAASRKVPGEVVQGLLPAGVLESSHDDPLVADGLLVEYEPGQVAMPHASCGMGLPATSKAAVVHESHGDLQVLNALLAESLVVEDCG